LTQSFGLSLQQLGFVIDHNLKLGPIPEKVRG
jgi:hypothetical protein